MTQTRNLSKQDFQRNAHVLKPDSVDYVDRKDKNGNQLLEVRYYDFDGKYLAEFHYLNNLTSQKKFNINFLRSHMRKPELGLEVSKVEEVIYYQKLFRVPSFVIARKQDKFWRITEKIFAEDFIK